MIYATDILTDDTVEQRVLRIKSKLMIGIVNHKRDKNLTQKQMAEGALITQPRISNIMNGQYSKVSIDELIRISYRLGIGLSVITETDIK